MSLIGNSAGNNLRVFRHIPTGSMFEERDDHYVNDANSSCHTPKWVVEGGKDFKEVPIPKYQILSFKHPENGNIYKLNEDNRTYGHPAVTRYSYNILQSQQKGLYIPYEECLKRYPIHSLKRLSDGLVVTSGQDGVWWINVANDDHVTVFIDKPISLESFVPTSKRLTITVKEGTKLIKTVTLNKGEQLLINY